MWHQPARLTRGVAVAVRRLAQNVAQRITQQGQHGCVTLVKLKQVVHVPQHPHKLAPVANLLRWAQAAGQGNRAGCRRTHDNHAPGLELHGPRPEHIGVCHIGAVLLLRIGCGQCCRVWRQARGPECVCTGRMPQILQQALQKLAAFKPAGGLRVTHVRAEIPVRPQHRAGAGLFQPCLPG